jgi:dihydroorotate dehydrogenase
MFCLPAEASRRLVVGTLGRLARVPGGLFFIDFLGHMKPPGELRSTLPLACAVGPVGLSSLVDPDGLASAAFSRFGAGFIEVGPVLASPGDTKAGWTRDVATHTLRAASTFGTTLDALTSALAEAPASVPLWVRLSADASPVERVVDALKDRAAAFVLDAQAEVEALGPTLRTIRERSAGTGQPMLLLGVRASDPAVLELARLAVESGADGLFLRSEQRLDDGSRLFAETCAQVSDSVRRLRAALPGESVIVAGGVYQPEDAQTLLEAGAQLTAVEAGMVFAGPGLLKRVNEALMLTRVVPRATALEPLALPAVRNAWFWALVLGLSMLLGGILTFAIASTRVVLPYDEALCGLNRAQLMQVNPRLLPFMAHDRMTLAGSMLSVGILYAALGWHGLRRGQHWAQVTVLLSALTGFASMFLFLGFGYFDPFHAFVTAVLFQFLLFCAFAPLGDDRPLGLPEWRESKAFRRAMWGQLIFVLLGAGFLVAGVVISYIGITSVFVKEDLEFMRTTAAELGAAHERLVALVAHDRASLGGMLMANGFAVLLSALWGFRAGAAWLWRALALAGNVAFAAAIGIHYVVGYDSWFHLAPAFLGWALWLLGLALCREWMSRSPAARTAAR